MLFDINYQPTEEERKEIEKQMIARACNSLLRLCHKRYKEEKNPLHAWSAYYLCRETDISFPEWLLQYLDEVAKGLQNPRRENERIGVFLQKALKMDKKGKGDVFQRYFDTERNIDAVCQILELLREGMTLENARSQVSSETEISEDTLNKWYYRHRENLLKPV